MPTDKETDNIKTFVVITITNWEVEFITGILTRLDQFYWLYAHENYSKEAPYDNRKERIS